MSTSPAAAELQEQLPPQAAVTVTVARSAGDAVPAPDPDPAPQGVAGGRERIDALDAELIELITRRVSVSAEIQAARLSAGGRRLDLRRETEVIGRYTQALGRPGTSVAMALLELGRGRV